jgi:hypothetical protein
LPSAQDKGCASGLRCPEVVQRRLRNGSGRGLRRPGRWAGTAGSGTCEGRRLPCRSTKARGTAFSGRASPGRGWAFPVRHRGQRTLPRGRRMRPRPRRHSRPPWSDLGPRIRGPVPLQEQSTASALWGSQAPIRYVPVKQMGPALAPMLMTRLAFARGLFSVPATGDAPARMQGETATGEGMRGDEFGREWRRVLVGEVRHGSSTALSGPVPEEGFEPSLGVEPKGILSPLRLPTPPLRRASESPHERES